MQGWTTYLESEVIEELCHWLVSPRPVELVHLDDGEIEHIPISWADVLEYLLSGSGVKSIGPR